MSRRRKRSGAHDEEHTNHERWLVTYADMVTLLMVLFIVMFAMSQVDQKKFDQLKAGLAVGFGQAPTIESGSTSILDQNGDSAAEAIAPTQFAIDTKLANASPATKANPQHADAQEQARMNQARDEVNRLKQLLDRLNRALRAHHLEDDVQASIDNRGLVVSLVSRHVVFEPNLATLSARGQQVVDTLAPVLRDIPDPLEIDGHTNQVKVKPKYYPTDWELSAARAVNVLRYLNEHGRVPASRMTAVAYGHERPLRDPALPGAAALNKRVDLIVVSTAPERSRKLFAQVLRDRSNGHDGGPAT